MQPPPNGTPITPSQLPERDWRRYFTEVSAALNEVETLNVTAKTVADTPYTITARNETVLVNAVGGAVTVKLPSVLSNGIFTVKKIDASANAVTISGNGANIDAAATAALAAQWNSRTIQGGPSQWHVIGSV